MNRILLALFAAFVSFGAGYVKRDNEFSSNTWTYTDIKVVSKISEKDFIIWPDRMKQQHIVLCSKSTVGWYENEILSDWTFEQRDGCKRVISYHEMPKGEINATIQIR